MRGITVEDDSGQFLRQKNGIKTKKCLYFDGMPVILPFLDL
jgi:hypothetical protein